MRDEIILIKLGGSVLTDKTKKQVLHTARLHDLVSEIAKFRETDKTKLIIAHGAGSFGHEVAQKYETKQGLIHERSLYGMADVARVAQKMNSLVIDAFLAKGMPAVSVSPRSITTTKGGVLEHIATQAIEELLHINALPVLFGDVVTDAKMGCTIFSSENILQALSGELSESYTIQKVIFVTDTDGVYGIDGGTIPEITQENILTFRDAIKGANGFDVTGGMQHKVDEALLLTKQGISSYIINGTKPQNVYNALTGERVSGTLIH